MAPPAWALMEWELIRAQERACAEFFERYFDERGYLECIPRWGGNDGPDDAIENLVNWPVLYLLGGADQLRAMCELGWEGHLNELPIVRSGVGADGAPGDVANFGNEHSTSGDGNITRSEVVDMELAAVVTQILPNGNLVVMGRQEVKVNNELREMVVSGIVRTSDIDTDNTIEHTKIAEMRVAYGGTGSLSDIQQPRWGMQVWDILFPF